MFASLVLPLALLMLGLSLIRLAVNPPAWFYNIAYEIAEYRVRNRAYTLIELREC